MMVEAAANPIANAERRSTLSIDSSREVPRTAFTGYRITPSTADDRSETYWRAGHDQTNQGAGVGLLIRRIRIAKMQRFFKTGPLSLIGFRKGGRTVLRQSPNTGSHPYL